MPTRTSRLAHYARQASRVLLLLPMLGMFCRDGTPTGVAFTISPDAVVLLVGETSQLTAIGAPPDVLWSSSNSQVATVVSVTGYVEAVGRGEATISAVSGSTVASATVKVEIPPALGLSAAAANFSMVIGEADPAAQSITISNTGDGVINGITTGPITYGSTEPTGWLTVTMNGASAPATLTLTARRGTLPRGVYTATVPVLAAGIANSPQQVAVMFNVQAPPSIVLSRTQVPMTGIPGVTVTETVSVSNGGDIPLTGLSRTITYTQGSPQNWLQATLGSTSAPATLTLVANTTGLAVGSYAATVRLASSLPNVTVRDVAVTLVVSPGPAISASPSTVNVSALFGANPPDQVVSLTNGGGGTLNQLTVDAPVYAAGQPTGWLSPAPVLAGSTAPTSLTLKFATVPLAAGTYNATLAVRSPVASNTPLTVSVVLVVSLPPVIALNPSSITFAAWGGSTIVPAGQNVIVTNTGGGTLGGLSTTIQYTQGSPGWLEAVLVGGPEAPTSYQLRPITANLAAGTYIAVVTFSSSISGVASKTVNVMYQIQTFTVDVLAVFAQGTIQNGPCAGCHSGSQSPRLSGTAQTIYNSVLGYVNPGSPSTSFLICKVAGSCAHSGGKVTGPQAITLSSWITAGAPFR